MASTGSVSSNSTPKPKQFSIPRNPDEEDQDYYNLFALMFGMMGLFLRWKMFIWQGLLFSILSLANMRSSERDWKAIMSTVGLSVVGFFVAYFSPQSNLFT